MIKYDACEEKVAARWAQPYNLPNEPYFIANPDGTEEDDGVILTVSYNFDEDKSSLVVIDPKTMETVQEYQIPFRMPWSFHSGFWADDWGQTDNQYVE